MRDGYRKLLNYVQDIEEKHGSVCMMTKRESNYMHKLSKLCYKNEQANLNQYEVAIIKRYLKSDINVRQLAYYLGGITEAEADYKARLYRTGRYELTNRKNYWEVRRR